MSELTFVRNNGAVRTSMDAVPTGHIQKFDPKCFHEGCTIVVSLMVSAGSKVVLPTLSLDVSATHQCEVD